MQKFMTNSSKQIQLKTPTKFEGKKRTDKESNLHKNDKLRNKFSWSLKATLNLYASCAFGGIACVKFSSH